MRYYNHDVLTWCFVVVGWIAFVVVKWDITDKRVTALKGLVLQGRALLCPCLGTLHCSAP